MAAPKQLALAVLLVLAGAVLWLRFAPGAGETLAGWGIDNALVRAIAPASEPTETRRAEGGDRGRGGNRGPQAAVIARPVTEATINDRLSAVGTGRSRASVVVKPYSSGRLTEIRVQSGQTVEAGAVIAVLDAEGESIAVDRAAIAVQDAQAAVDRVSALRRSNTASAVQVTEAELALANARLVQREAELALERRSVIAPIAGIVGIVPVELGNTVTAESTIATVDDRSTILVDFWVPERFATVIAVGDRLTATAIARPAEVLEGTVGAVDSRIDEASRTLQVRAEIPNPDDTLRPGQSFQVAMRFAGDTYPSVDPLSVQWGSDGAFVWVVRNGNAERMPVRIIQRNTETVLVDAQLNEGERVVTEGIHTVRQGQPVMVADAPPDPAPEPIPSADAGSDAVARPRAAASEL